MKTLQQWREAKGWRREDLAVHAHVGLRTITRAEWGQRVPGAAIRFALATALGVAMEDIDWQAPMEEHAS